ncbi:MAG: hypothetical protein LW847_15375 [Burkholderiales bacterium]|jgi:hypothetical protein|nr:hypothetical protein [Burkholderiales bacterium]
MNANNTRTTANTSSSPRSPALLRASGATAIGALAIGMAFGGWHPAPVSTELPASIDPTFEQAVVPAASANDADAAAVAPVAPVAAPNSGRDEFDDSSLTIWLGQSAG